MSIKKWIQKRFLHNVSEWDKLPKSLQQWKILTERLRLPMVNVYKAGNKGKFTFIVEEDKTRLDEFIKNNYKKIEIYILGTVAENVFNNASHCADETEEVVKKELGINIFSIQYTQIVCEFLYFFLYLIDRYCCNEFNLDKRDRIMDPLIYGIYYTTDENIIPVVNPKFQRKMTLAEKIKVSDIEKKQCWKQKEIIENMDRITIPSLSFSKDSEWIQRCKEYSNYEIIWESYGSPFKDTVWGECIKHIYEIAYGHSYERNNPAAFSFSAQVFNFLTTHSQGHIEILNAAFAALNETEQLEDDKK